MDVPFIRSHLHRVCVWLFGDSWSSGRVRWGDSERMAERVQGGVEERRMTRIQQVQHFSAFSSPCFFLLLFLNPTRFQCRARSNWCQNGNYRILNIKSTSRLNWKDYLTLPFLRPPPPPPPKKKKKTHAHVPYPSLSLFQFVRTDKESGIICYYRCLNADVISWRGIIPFEVNVTDAQSCVCVCARVCVWSMYWFILRIRKQGS